MSPTKFCFALFVVFNLHNGNAVSAHIGRSFRPWPNGIVHFIESATFPESERAKVHDMFRLIQNVTCIRFLPVNVDFKDHLYIKAEHNSSQSELGYQGDKQVLGISIKSKLPVLETAYHFLRSLGFSGQLLSQPFLKMKNGKAVNFTETNIFRLNLMYKCYSNSTYGRPWPNATVNTRISHAFLPAEKERVTSMVDLIQAVSCIRFTEADILSNERVYIRPDFDKFISELGYSGRRQILGISKKPDVQLEEIAYHFLRTLGVHDRFMSKPLLLLEEGKPANITEENITRLNLLYDCYANQTEWSFYIDEMKNCLWEN